MKLKTKKAAQKRFRISSTGKFKRRAVRQAHFNAKNTGDETRRKHHDEPVDSTDRARLTRLLPYIS